MAARQQAVASALAVDGTVIGPDIEVRGRVEGDEELRVEGRIEGSIALSEALRVQESGVVVANVRAREVLVSGIVLGDVEATERIRLEPGSRLVGNLKAPSVYVADGAVVSLSNFIPVVHVALSQRQVFWLRILKWAIFSTGM